MPYDFTTPGPLKDAVAAISGKTPIGSVLRSREWEELVPDGLKQAGLFSAGVESVKALSRLQVGLGQIVNEARDASHGGLAMDRGKLVEQIQKLANAEGLRTDDQAKRGTIQDFGSEARTKLIIEQQIGAAQAQAYWQQGNDPDVLAAFPAQQLLRVRHSTAPRAWAERWKAAAAVHGKGVASDGSWIALKSSPIWRALSRFDRPFPPFDFQSGMGVEDVDRETAEALGLLAPGDVVKPTVRAWNDDLSASVKTLSPDCVEFLKHFFGPQIRIADGMARWGPAAQDAASPEGESDGSLG